LLTLDLNRDGHVDSLEISAFAKAQGYDAAPTVQEFMGLDADHNGYLDMTELSSALSSVAAAPPAVALSDAAAPVQQEAVLSKVQPVQLTALPLTETQTAASNEAPGPGTAVSQSVLLGEQHETQSKELDAQAAASRIASELSIQAKKENNARFLDLKAAELRANSTALTRQTVQRVLEVGSEAARLKSSQLLQTLSKLEDEAKEAEVQAAALRAKSRAELEQASDFMTIANAALGTSNQGS